MKSKGVIFHYLTSHVVKELASESVSRTARINHLYSSLGTRRLHRGGPPSIPARQVERPLRQPPVGEYFDVLYNVTSRSTWWIMLNLVILYLESVEFHALRRNRIEEHWLSSKGIYRIIIFMFSKKYMCGLIFFTQNCL